MDNNYYIPELEEICVGFKYEGLHHTRFFKMEDDKIDKWNPYSFNGKLFLNIYKSEPDNLYPDLKYYFNQLLEAKLIRVKYLDREDITELGWKKDSGDLDFILDSYQLEIIAKDYKNPAESIYLITADFGYYNLFMGKIKNYNELQKLMLQLNITKDVNN